MKERKVWRAVLAPLFALLVLAVVLLPTAPAQAAPPPLPGDVMAAMFTKHSDFDCVRNGYQVPDSAREPSLDAFADDAHLNQNMVQCFFYTWLFDRDSNALNRNFEPGSGVPKGHYVKRGVPCPTDAAKLCFSDKDHAALHASDLNEVIYELGGMPEFNYLDDGGYPTSNRWVRYPTRFLRYNEIPF